MRMQGRTYGDGKCRAEEEQPGGRLNDVAETSLIECHGITIRLVPLKSFALTLRATRTQIPDLRNQARDSRKLVTRTGAVLEAHVTPFID